MINCINYYKRLSLNCNRKLRGEKEKKKGKRRRREGEKWRNDRGNYGYEIYTVTI
jgi:hypothetical protein